MVGVTVPLLTLRFSLSVALVCAAGGMAWADAATGGERASSLPSRDLMIDNAWARATPPGVSVGAVYMTLKNDAGREDQLTAVRSPIAARAEIHNTRQEHGMMSMRRVDMLALPPGTAVNIAPGGVHIMLIGLTKPLAPGQRIHLTLQFMHHVPIELDVPVRGEP